MTRWLVIGSWITFYLYWVAHARVAKATAERQSIAATLPYRALTLGGGVLLFLTALPDPMRAPVLPVGPVARCAGAATCLLGLALAIWARRTLGDNWSSIVVVKRDHELIERGPYHHVRHPIYSAILLMSLGTAVCFNRLACFAGLVPLVAGFWIKLRQEEAVMLRQFPEQYPRYKARVSALVPGVL
jgi:protein-S-isoprenylcysteine O-methyltransferase Ste14